MNKFNPRDYQIQITSSIHSSSGKTIFCARVTELKNIYVEESTINKAYEQALEEIKIFKQHYDEQGIDFPLPIIYQEFSGELRVRLGKELHKQIAVEAARNGVSLNKLIKEKLKKAS